jgi:hypothetical protein
VRVFRSNLNSAIRVSLLGEAVKPRLAHTTVSAALTQLSVVHSWNEAETATMTDSNEKPKTIRFRLEYITREFKFDDARIVVSDPAKRLEATLTKRPAEFASFPTEPDDGLIVGICERRVTDRLCEQAASSGQLSVRQEAVASVHTDIRNFILRTLRLLRWRTKSPGRPYPIRAVVGFSWSWDGVEWKPVTDYMSLRIKQVENPPILTDAAIEFARTEILGELDEPLGHELLREAWTNQDANLRSAIVIAVAAAEVGFKQFAAKTLPDTAWILENLQSPPLSKMLDLFPWDKMKLQINGRPVTVPDSIKDELKKAVTLRNEIVHGRSGTLTSDTSESVLYCVRDLLYFLDALTDRKTWAFEHMSVVARNHFTDK